jgi:hypothetical protein
MIKKFFTVCAITALIATAACGKKEDQQAATPPPAPANPNPAPAPVNPFAVGGTVPGTQCPMVPGEIPLWKDGAFYGQFDNGPWGQYGSGSNSLTLSAAFIRYTNAAAPVQNIVAGALLTFPDLVRVMQNAQNVNTNICVSSANFGQSSPTPGTFNLQDQSVNMVLRGTIPVPLYSPFGGYPTGGQAPQGQEIIEVSIGQTCRAYLYQGRVVGCIDIRLGMSQNSPQLHYNSR